MKWVDLGSSKMFLDFNQYQNMIDYLANEIEILPSDLPTKKITEHAEERRIMPPGTPRPGPLDFEYTPYLKNILDDLSPQSPIQRVVVLKGAQIGMTLAAECVLGYYMDELPSDILFLSGNDKTLETWSSRRLEPMIDSYGIREKMAAPATNSKSRRTGDKMLSKEYSGVRLDMVSSRSASRLRAVDKRILIRDEIDGAPAQLTTGEGNFLEVSAARTNAWGDRRKIFDLSTPTLESISQIYASYKLGDQNKFNVPCPHCKEKFVLDFKFDSGPGSFHGVIENGYVKDCYYQCPHCEEKIFNHHKGEMLAGGVWEPSAKSTSPFIKSYHISALYAPPGMISWREVYEKKIATDQDPENLPGFYNLIGGLPYREKGSRPKARKIMENQGDYISGTIPDGVLFLTAGVDVQRGSERDGKEPRIECQILGHGLNKKVWSISYQVYEGPVDDAYSGAWEKLFRAVAEGGAWSFDFKNQKMHVVNAFFDSGDGQTQAAVYEFMKRMENGCYAIKGQGKLKKLNDIDPFNARAVSKWKRSKTGDGEILIIINTNYYKNMIYNNLRIDRQQLSDQKPGFIDTPMDYGSKYYKQLTAEERLEDGTFDAGGRANEALDTFVYALCAADVYLINVQDAHRAAARSYGNSENEILSIDVKFVLNLIAQKVEKS